MNKLVNMMIHKGYLKSDAIINAFAEVPRVEFMPKRFRSASEADIPIPLGYGHMLPSPSIVAYMLELMQPAVGHNILVAGFGGGWVTALLCFIAGKSGHVTSVDISEGLGRDATTNIAKFSFIERDHIVELRTIKSCAEIPPEKKFDRIIVLNTYFTDCHLENLLAKDGILVTPFKNVVHCYTKQATGEVSVDVYSGMAFLPTSTTKTKEKVA